MYDPTPRQTLLIGLLALIPVAAYGYLRSEPVMALSIASVLLVLWSLFVAFTPVTDETNISIP